MKKTMWSFSVNFMCFIASLYSIFNIYFENRLLMFIFSFVMGVLSMVFLYFSVKKIIGIVLSIAYFLQKDETLSEIQENIDWLEERINGSFPEPENIDLLKSRLKREKEKFDKELQK